MYVMVPITMYGRPYVVSTALWGSLTAVPAKSPVAHTWYTFFWQFTEY